MKNKIRTCFTAALALLLALSLASCGASKSMGGFAYGVDGDCWLYAENWQAEGVAGEASDDTEGFAENPFISTAENDTSTFSADVDTASYTYFRKLVNSGYTLSDLKNTGTAFRTEEFVNYFSYRAKTPTDEELFGVQADLFACPWNASSQLLRVTLQAEEQVSSAGNNLVFLIDVSGSMGSSDKLPLLQQAFSILVGNLTARDTVSIVTYSGKEAVILEGCSGAKSDQILSAIRSLTASGSTNGEAGLSEAYRIAEKYRIEGGNNRIIMASDGDLNVGISSAEELKTFVEGKRDQGIYLSVLGFGTGNYRDANMEALADNGNGVYYYIDGESEAERVFGSKLLGTLYTVAEDVKLQITFDSRYVASYRLIGYENRLLNQEDFSDDTKDAGEVGAGHQVTVCYELILTEDAPGTEEDWMQLAVRYKNPGESDSNLNTYGIGKQNVTGTPDEDLQFLTCVIETVMVLHDSQYLGNVTQGAILETLQSMDFSQEPERAEFCRLLQTLLQQ